MKIRVLAVAILVLPTLQYSWSDIFEQTDATDLTPIHTFDLLSQADKVIRLDESPKDVVVLVGNPGAGSTTVGKILATNSTQLEAYYSDVHQKYLIRDLSVMDSNETCQISSQLPRVMTNPEIGLTLYVLPSYRGSNCPNRTELGRVLFSRRLAQHAKSIKILLVADYNSIFERGDYFKNLIETAFSFSPSLGNFSNSVGLVVTNVDRSDPDAVIINRVREFISGLKDLATARAPEDPALAQLQRLLTSLLQDGKNGQPKIHFTRVPTRPGRLSDLAEIMEMRTKLADLVSRNLENTSFSPSDLRYLLNDTDREALESVLNEILKYIARLQRKLESVLTELYSSEVGYLRQLPPQQLKLIYSARNAQELFPDPADESALTKIPFWVTAYITERTMNALEGVIIPLNSSFAAVRQELKDREYVLRSVHEILGTLPDDDTLKGILHAGDETSASWFQPLLDFQRIFCAQLNNDIAETCSSPTGGENSLANHRVLKRRCVLGQVICRVLNEFGVPIPTSSPVPSDFSTSSGNLLFDRLLEADKRSKLNVSHRNLVLFTGPASTEMGPVVKLLTTDGAQLESYYHDVQGKYRIRELNTTVTVSSANPICQLPFSPPTLMIHPENDLTFYKIPSLDHADCPNYIEHVLHLRRLVKHANSVKILFIVDSDSFLGASNDTFYNWIYSAASLFNSMEKLNNSVGLVATGVDTRNFGAYSGILISSFLTDFAAEILEADSEPSGEAAKTLGMLDVILDGVGPNRERVLEFTPALTRPGRLNELPEMVKTRTRLANLVSKSLKGTKLSASELNISLPHADKIALGSVLDSIYNFTASQMTSSLNAFSREHTPDQLPPTKQIILHEFMRDLTLVQIYQEFMNGIPNVPFFIMSSFLKSSIKVAQNIFLPYNLSLTDLPEQLMEQENASRLVHEILGTIDDDGSETSSGQETNYSASEALASLRSRFCPAFEANVTGTVCGNISFDNSNNGAIDLDVKSQCSAAFQRWFALSLRNFGNRFTFLFHVGQC